LIIIINNIYCLAMIEISLSLNLTRIKQSVGITAGILTFLSFWVIPLICSLFGLSLVPCPRLHALEILGFEIGTLDGNNDLVLFILSTFIFF
jgi:hypothetical protein